MCGIIGQVGELEESISFSKYMYMRGPDCQKITRKGKVQFGHALLAIQGSNPIVQPIEGKNSLLIFNGEIYNWCQIQNKFDLSSGDSDTIILNELINKVGFYGAVSELMGMYSIAYYSEIEHKLFLARDYFGEKPLYYSISQSSFKFSSLASDLGSINNLNNEWISEFIYYGYSLKNETIFNNVFELERNTVLELCCSSLRFKINKVQQRIESKESNLIILDEIIELESKASVPFCTLLSGGIDSTYINKILSFTDKNFESYTLDFDDTISEAKIAQRTSKLLGIKNNQILFKITNSDIEMAIQSMDLPISDPSFFPTWFLFKNIGKKYRLSLSGDGGDELFYGYKRHRLPFITWFIIRSIIPSRLLNAIQNGLPNIPCKIKFLFEMNVSRFYFRIISDGYYNGEIDDSFTNSFSNELRKLIDLEKDYFLKNVLRKVDTASMANSVENRSPFLSTWLQFKRKYSLFSYLNSWKKRPIRKKVQNLIGLSALFKKGFTPNIENLIHSMEPNNNQSLNFIIKSEKQKYRLKVLNLWLKSRKK